MPWGDFIGHWCLGAQPAFDDGELTTALAALERNCPEYLDTLEQSGSRGLWPIMNAVRLGMMMSRTENLPGFPEALSRMRQGEASAGSELECAAALVRAGVPPSLGAPLAGKVLDLVFTHSGRPHYVEVVAPNRSDAMREAEALLAKMGRELASTNRGMNVEVLLAPTFRDEQIEELIAAVTAASPAPEIHDVSAAGRFRKGKATSANVAPSIPRTHVGPALAFATGGFDGEVYTVTSVRFPIDDDRAQRTFAGELHHFSRDEANLLFMDLTRVVGGIGSWMPLIANCFQPTRNTRVGAVVLFERATVAGQDRVWERWKVLPNPYARVPPTEALVNAIRSLDFGPIPQMGS